MSTTTTTVAGRYTLREELGSGGMGVVWHAFDELLQRDVAVKEVRFPAGISDADRNRLAERTLNEARAVAVIDTAAAVRVFDIVEQDGRPWIVMELVRGRTLTEVLGTSVLPSAEVARIGLCVLEALEVAHRAGVLHRDVKPSNVIVGEDGRIALTDFGIATVDGDPGDATTGVVVGTPGYLAPERARGEPATPASDLWSLGATLWTAAEGRPPYAGGSPAAVLATIAGGEPPECLHCAGPLAEVLLSLMALDPADRPEPAVVREALEAVCRDFRLQAAQANPLDPYPLGALPAAFDRTTLLEPTARSAAAPSREGRTWPLLVAFGAVLLLSAGVLTAVLQSGPSAPGGSGAAGGKRSGSAHGAAALPSGWHRYDGPDGWSIGVPRGWQAVAEGTGVRLDDPAGGRYVEVATRFPAAASAVGAWQAQEQAFAGTHSAYQRIAIRPQSVSGARDAADWEFTYVDGGAALHALDRAIVVGRHGYAVFFQTHSDQWDASQRLRERVLSTFVAHH
jgi:tRNA A-37 threonylcarbamoyl transferase component Bud32